MQNKTIKFRVWVNDEKRFRYCEYIPTMGFVWMITSDVKNINPPRAANLEFLEIGENYPQQFTGLVDKNGKEIYENDIVNVVGYEDWDDNTEFDVTCIVLWCPVHAGWRVFTKKMIDSEYSGNKMSNPITILGNFNENPNLLK